MKTIRALPRISAGWALAFAAALASGIMTSQAQVPSDQVSFWHGDGNALDSKGTNNGATFNNLTYTNGLVNQAFQMGNVGPGLGAGWVRVTNSITDFEVANVSVAAWVRALYPPPYGYIVNKCRDGGAGGAYCLFSAAPYNTAMWAPRAEGGGGFYLWDGNNKLPMRAPLGNQNKVWDGVWHLLVGTFDGGYSRFFVDGAEQGTAVPAAPGAAIGYLNNAGTGKANNGDLGIGDFSLTGALHFYGDVDEVQFFNRALSPQEILDMYKSLNTNLISWWEAEDSANDSIGANHGTIQGTVIMQTGRAGKAFNVAGGVIVVPDSPTLQPAAVTLEARVHAAQAPGINKFIISKSNNSTGPSYGFSTGPNGGLVFLVTTGSGTVLSADAGPSIWDNEYHVVFSTYDGSSVLLYVDGAAVGSGVSASGSIQYGTSQSNGELLFGDFQDTPGPQNFSGHVDEIKVYDRALTAQEISARMPKYLAAYITPNKSRVNVGASLTLAANTRGPLSPINNGQPLLSYQWRKDGTPLAGATNSTLVLTPVQTTNIGRYDVQITPNPVTYTPNGIAGSAFHSVVPIRVPDAPSLEPENITVQVWARSSQAPGGYKYMVAKCWGPNSGTMLAFGLSTVLDSNTNNPIRNVGFPHFAVRLNAATYLAAPDDFSRNLWDGQWHQFTGTYDGGAVHLYIDGMEAGSGTPTVGLPLYYAHTNQYVAGDLILGDYSIYTSGFHWTNDLDEVKIFNRALTGDEIAASYAAMTNNPAILTNAPGLVSWWRGENNLLDSVGGNHGLASTVPLKNLITTPASVSLFASITNMAVAGGNFQAAVINANGDTYAVQRSSDLTNWVAIVTNTVPFTFTDSVGSTKNFYRAVLQQ